MRTVCRRVEQDTATRVRKTLVRFFNGFLLFEMVQALVKWKTETIPGCSIFVFEQGHVCRVLANGLSGTRMARYFPCSARCTCSNALPMHKSLREGCAGGIRLIRTALPLGELNWRHCGCGHGLQSLPKRSFIGKANGRYASGAHGCRLSGSTANGCSRVMRGRDNTASRQQLQIQAGRRVLAG